MARPTADQPRDKTICIRVNDAEHREITAHIDGRNRSDLLRRVILEHIRKK